MNLDVKMEEIFKEVCNIDESIPVSDDMNFNDIEGWDSLANIQLVTELESVFNIKFDFEELLEIQKWGDYKELVKNKINIKYD